MTKAKQRELLKALEKYTDAITSSKAKAREALVEEGIYLEDGRLAPEYKDSVAA